MIAELVLQCADCGGSKSTDKTIRCWDCSMIEKKLRWNGLAVIKAKEILRKRKQGASMTSIALEMGVSRQRVYQIVGRAGMSVKDE